MPEVLRPDDGAAEPMEAVGKEAAADEQMSARGLEEVVADKGYHSGPRLEDLREIGVRSYISEPQRGRRHWQGKAGGQAAVYGNRRRLRGERGKQWLRQGELLERSFAHVYDTGGMRRTHLRGHRNILKRLLLQVAAFNLSVSLRFFNVFGPRQDPTSPCSGVLSLFIAALLAGRAPKIFGDGEQSRDFISVDNAVEAMLLACTAPEAVGKVFIVATRATILAEPGLCSIIGANIEPIYGQLSRAE